MKFSIPKPRVNLRPKIDIRQSSQSIRDNYRKATFATKSRLNIEPISIKDRILSAASYIFIIGLVERLFNKNRSEFLNYHQKQSILLLVILALVLLIPVYGFTIFGSLIIILMGVNLIVAAFGGTLRLMPR